MPKKMAPHSKHNVYRKKARQEESSREIKLKPEADFLSLLFSGSGDSTAGMAFAGWGISAPDLG